MQPFDSLKTADQLAAWGAAQARAGNLVAAHQALQDAVLKRPGDPQLLDLLSQIQMRLGNWRTAFNTLSEAREKSKDPSALKRQLIAALYLQPPDSFQNAISIANDLLSDPEMERDPYVQLWLAPAYGQRYSWFKDRAGSLDEINAARDNALKAVKRVASLTGPNHPARILLRQISNP